MLKMKKISVEELKPGMVYNKPVYVDSSNMLVNANSPILEEDIKKLMKWGVTEVETAGTLVKSDSLQVNAVIQNDDERKIITEYNDLLKKRKRLLEIHAQARKSVDAAYSAIRANREFKIEDLENAVFNIIDIIKENSNVFLFLYGLDEGKDYTVTHSVNVTFYAILIGIALQYNNQKLNDLGLGTMLIDSGMAKIPIYIAHKQSNLTEQEFKQIKMHPLLGYRALKELGKLKESSALVTLQHHEQFDGKGYPRGLKGNEIDEFARIASIADSYEAQISDRSYRKSIYFYHAMRNLLSSGVTKFDPVILRVFLSRMSVYPIGSIVELNDATIGIVIGSIPEKPLRPLIKMIFDKEGKKFEKTIILNLLTETSYYIVKALNESDVGINIFEAI